MGDSYPLDFVDAVRLRPGMYLGGTDDRALLTLLFAALRVPCDLAAEGLVTQIDITLHPNNQFTVRDNGPGFPVEKHRELLADHHVLFISRHIPVVYHWSLLTIAHAASTQSRVEIRQAGQVWEQHFAAGRPQAEIKVVRSLLPGESTGNTLTCEPDPLVFNAGVTFRYPDLYVHLRELAYLLPRIRITLNDERGEIPQIAEFYSEQGVADFVRYLNRDCESLHDVIPGTEEVEFRPAAHKPFTVRVDYAIQFTDCAEAMILSFANLRFTPEGGIHVQSLQRGVWGALEQARKRSPAPPRPDDPPYSQALAGMTAVIAVSLPQAKYYGCAATELANPEASVVYPIVYWNMVAALQHDPDILKSVLERGATRHLTPEVRRYGDWVGRTNYQRLMW